MPKVVGNKKIAVIFVVPLIIVILLGLFFYRNGRQTIEYNHWVAHTFEVISAVTSIRTDIKDMERGQRGYLLTGKEDYLTPYNIAVGLVGPDFDNAWQLTKDNAIQQKRLGILGPFIVDKAAELKKTIGLRRTQGFEAAEAVVATDVGKRDMDSILRVITEIINQEHDLFKNSIQAQQVSINNLTLISLLGIFLVFLFSIATSFLIHRVDRATVELHRADNKIKIIHKELQFSNEELENKNMELKKLDQLKDDFINNVSHELRTPLTIIQGGISVMADGLLGPVNERQHAYLDKTLVNVDRLTNIINDLLDISTIEKGKLKLNKHNVDLVELVKEAVSNFTPQFEKKGLVIKYVVPNQRVEVFVDKDKMIQVLTNLINNACKFTDKGSIEVSVCEDNSYIKCCIKDTGIGIAPQDLSRLFSKFEQMERQEGAGPKGTGLGLSIAKGIIETHEGQITVESEIGQGTQFIITLPKLDVIQESSWSLTVFLKENIDKYSHFSALVFSIKDFDVKQANSLDILESLIKSQLYRQMDHTVKDKGSVYVILPDTKKENAIVVANRIRQIIHTKECKEQLKDCEGIIYKIVSSLEESFSVEALMVNLEMNKEEL